MGTTMGGLMVLSMHEKPRVDTRRVAEILHELGDTAGQSVICVALEKLAQGLADIRGAAFRGDMADLARQSELLSRLAWQLGLVSLAGVSVDVAICAERRDATALAATLARLMRIGNRSLTDVWDDDATVS